MECLWVGLSFLCLLTGAQAVLGFDLSPRLSALSKSASEANVEAASAISRMLREAMVNGVDGWGSGWYCRVPGMNATMLQSPNSTLCFKPGGGCAWSTSLSSISYNGTAMAKVDVGGGRPWRLETEAPLKADVAGIAIDVELERNATGKPSMLMKSCKLKVDSVVVDIGGSLDGRVADHRTDFLRGVILTQYKFRIEFQLQTMACSSIRRLMNEGQY